MPRYHSVNGVLTQFTPEEETLFDKEAAAWEAGAPARAVAEVQADRRAAYQAEADPLFFEEHRGEVPEGTHAAKVSEIKARFPKPE